MVKTLKSLASMTAQDLMSHPAEMIPQQMSLQAAARLMRRSQITGAPVVDQSGRCVGVISTSDFVYHVEHRGTTPETRHEVPVYVAPGWQPAAQCPRPDEDVASIMTKDPVTVRPSTHIGELTRMMIDAHIHRVVVTDIKDHPIGIVSTTDILTAVAKECGTL